MREYSCISEDTYILLYNILNNNGMYFFYITNNATSSLDANNGMYIYIHIYYILITVFDFDFGGRFTIHLYNSIIYIAKSNYQQFNIHMINIILIVKCMFIMTFIFNPISSKDA